jgi:Uma2 family endonuclease
MATVTTQRMTAEEFFEWCHRPENRDRHFELERGEVVEMGRPGERHGVVCSNVNWVLAMYVRQRGKGYVCSNDAGIIWERDPDSVRGPDVVLYEGARRFDQLNPKYTDQLPPLVVEVVSPGDRWSKVTRRITQFLKRGVSLVWLVDPEDRTVTIFRADQLPQVVEENEEITGDPAFPDLRCRVADFFFMPGEQTP